MRLVWALALVVGSACASRDSAFHKPLSVPPDAVEPAQLIEAGAEPRRPLRYRAEPPPSKNIQLELTTGVLAMRRQQQDAEIESLVPPLAMVVQLAAAGVRDGAASYAFRLADLEIVPVPTDADGRALRQHLRVELGSGGHVSFDTRGRWHEFEISDPLGFRASVFQRWMMHSLAEALEQLAVPLPEEPVGAGAIWTWTVVRNRGGFEIRRSFTARLVSLQGDRGRVDLNIVATARSLGEAAREVTEIKSQGTGSADFYLGCPIALPIEIREGVAVHEASARGAPTNEFVTVFFSGLVARAR